MTMAEYKAGDIVRIKVGPFASFAGRVETISPEAERLTVAVTIFGRSTPVELSYDEVEKGDFGGDPGTHFFSNN